MKGWAEPKWIYQKNEKRWNYLVDSQATQLYANTIDWRRWQRKRRRRRVDRTRNERNYKEVSKETRKQET